MPVFVDASSQDQPIGEKFPLGFAESVKTGFEETMISGPFYGGLLANEIRKANQTGNKIDLATAKARAQEEGVPDLRIPSQGMTDQGLETMIAIAKDRAEGEEKLSRASGFGAFAGSLAGSMDPVAGPLNFVPIVGGAREAAILAKASVKMGVAGRILARGAIGAVEGAVGAGITVPLNAVTREATGDDYTVDDAFNEVVSSAVLGGVAQAGLGQIGEAIAPFADRSSHKWVREKFGTEALEWKTLVEHDKRVAETIAPDHIKADEAPVRAESAPVARGIEADPDRVVEAGPAATLREAIGNRPVIYEAATREDPLAVEIVAAMRVSQAEIAKAPQAFEPIAKAMDALTLDRSSGFSIEEGLQFGAAKTLESFQLDAARTAMALSGQPERMARFVSSYVEATKRGDAPEVATNAAISQISTPQGPAEKGRIASEQTMTNAEAIADFQAKSGIVINPEKVIDADGRIQQADQSAPADEVARAMDPASRYDAKELREGADRAKELEAEPDADDFATLADEAEAELERLRTGVEGEGARFAEAAPLPESIDIGGVQRSTKDSTGRRLGGTEEEVRNFWNWFGDSKVVDEAGNPLVVYHGTDQSFDSFDPGMLGKLTGAESAKKGFFFASNPENAGFYAGWTPSKEGYDYVSSLVKEKEDAVRVVQDEFSARNRAGRRIRRVDEESFLTDAQLIDLGYKNNEISRLRDKWNYTQEELEFYRQGKALAKRLANAEESLDIARTLAVSNSIGRDFGSGLAPNIMPVNLRIENPLIHTQAGDFRDITFSDLLDRAKSQGNDGVIIRNTKDPLRGDVFVALSPTQIKSATGNRGTFDPTNPDIRFAESNLPGAQSPAEVVRAEIADRFGADLVKLGEANGLQVVNSWRDIPGATRESVIGMAKDGKVWIAAHGIAKGQATSVYLHEMGAHVGLQKMLGEKGFADLQAKVSSVLDRSPELAAIIRAAVPHDTDPRYHAEEQLAYLVQHFEQGLTARGDWWPKGAAWARITDPEVRRAIVDLVREIVAQAKAWLYENAPSLRGMPLDERDIHALAVRSLRSAGEASSGTRFAKATEEADSEIAAAKDLSKRVREVYKKAYDKLAAAPELDDADLVVAAQSAGMEKAEAVEMVKRFRKMGGDTAKALKDDMNKAELVRYRAVLNALKLHEGMSQILRFKGKETEGALSLDAGSEYNIQGARRSVESQRKGWEKTLVGGAEWELIQGKLFDLASDRAQAPHIVNALFDLQMGRAPDGAKYNDDHLKIAEIIDRYQQRSLKEQRRRGVDIGQIKGRMLHQSHDKWALRNFANGSRAGATRAAFRDLLGKVLPDRWVRIGDDAHMKAWVEFVGPLLEPETYDGRAVDLEYLEGSYKLLAGFKEPSKDRELLSGKYSTGGVPGEAARLSNLGRNMKFKGPDEWIAYQKRCGNPDLLANFFGEQAATARSLGIIDIYGPGGENTRATLHQAIGQQLVGKQAMDWQDGRKKREVQWAVTSGKINSDGSEIVANAGANLRTLTNAAIMGGSVLSQAPDMANAGKWRALRFNRGANGVFTEGAAQMQDFARSVSGSPKIRQVLEACRADLDATVGGLLRAVEDGDSKGFASNLIEKIYKYQGATWFNRNNRNASTLGFSAWLGSESRLDFDNIEPTTREMLLQHEIRANTWDLIRKSELIAEDGRSYLTPEGVNGIPQADIAAHIEGLGRKPTDANIAQWREDAKFKITAMLADEVGKSLLEPTGRQRATSTGGLSSGTISGQFVRFAWQAKSFAISQIQRGWMSEIRGRSSDPRARVRSGSGSHYLAVANYIAALTALGYVSYALKGWASGVNRKGIFEKGDEDDKVLFFDLPGIDDRVLFAAMNQGGGLGIYGDFLFADADRFGGGFMQTLSGPTIGKLEDAYKLWRAAKTADSEDAGKLANQAVRMLKGATPFGNLWWSRQIMDRVLWWNLQESINPAGLRRLEDAAKKRGDTYIFTRPTNALN
jgi:hypothetical protein